MAADELTNSIQEAVLRVYKVFREICEKNNLIYFALGGTCIGAVRHHGFIPWDDDIDVFMPIEDYLQFRELASKELDSGYAIIGPHNCKHYRLSWMKLHDINTTFVEVEDMPYIDRYSGVFIDIFPVYGLPEGDKDKYKLIKQNEIFRRNNLRRRFPISELTTVKAKAYWCMLQLLTLNKPFSYYTDRQEKLLGQYRFECSDKVFFSWRFPGMLPKAYNPIMDYADFSSSIIMPFEDTYMPVPVGYDHFLTCDFGDYMKLPPIEKRVSSHHIGIVDLGTPFSFYQKHNNIKEIN